MLSRADVRARLRETEKERPQRSRAHVRARDDLRVANFVAARGARRYLSFDAKL